MLSTLEIKQLIEEHKHSSSVSAEKIYWMFNNRSITFNPYNQLPQTTFQVRKERDALFLSVRSLKLYLERMKRMNQNKLLTIGKLKRKIIALEADRDKANQAYADHSEMNRHRVF